MCTEYKYTRDNATKPDSQMGAGLALLYLVQDPGHDLQSTCGIIEFRWLPPPGANTELVPSMARPARGAKFFNRYPESLS